MKICLKLLSCLCAHPTDGVTIYAAMVYDIATNNDNNNNTTTTTTIIIIIIIIIIIN